MTSEISETSQRSKNVMHAPLKYNVYYGSEISDTIKTDKLYLPLFNKVTIQI